MVRPRKPTQTPQAPGLEAGAAYGEPGQNLEAQEAIPLRQKGLPGEPPAGAVAAAPPEEPQQQNPFEAAAGFPNTVTPLTAPGKNLQRPTKDFQVTNEMRAATLLKDWAENTTHPAVIAAAQQMEAHLRNG